MRVIYNILQRNVKMDFGAVHFHNILQLSSAIIYSGLEFLSTCKRLGYLERCELHFMNELWLHFLCLIILIAVGI